MQDSSPGIDTRRLLVFVEQRFWRQGDTFSTDEPFVLFLNGLLPRVSRLIYAARLEQEERTELYRLNDQSTVWPVPAYPSLMALSLLCPLIIPIVLGRLLRRRREWDMACICGPHPLGLAVALGCWLLRRPAFLIVRENLVTLVGLRYPPFLRAAAVAFAWLLEQGYALAARRWPLFVVGGEVRERYRRLGVRGHPLVVSLVRREELASPSIPARPEGPVELLTVARLVREKGVDFLLQAVAVLRSEQAPIHLTIVGDGPERVALEALARELSLGPLVAFRGYVPYGEELLRWYRRAHILVVPSLTEGIPQVVIEAMANSVAIVATRVGGIPSLVEDGETGLLVAAGSAEDLAAALRRMVVEPGLRCRLVERAREAVSRFTREAQLDAIVRVMQEWGRQPLAS